MEKVNQIIYNIANSIQLIVDVLLGLCFQPIYAVTTIIQGIIEILMVTDEVEEPLQQPQQTVTTYPSTNEGRYAEECDLPACEEHHIGFKINRTEQDEIKRIKEELNGK